MLPQRRPPHYPPSRLSPHVELIGSCYGLICLYESRKSSFLLYNPVTQAYKRIPKLSTKMSRRPYKSFCHHGDFAYDYVAGDFKVFYFVTYYYDLRHSKVGEESHIYSLKANSWEMIPNPPLRKDRSHSVVTNNFLHWRLCLVNCIFVFVDFLYKKCIVRPYQYHSKIYMLLRHYNKQVKLCCAFVGNSYFTL